jgi:hypothetical protein
MIKKLAFTAVLLAAMFTGKAADNKLFPEVTGWKVQEDKRVYNSGDLWELIDGAADIFLSYNFQDLHVAEYSSKNAIIRVELYRHNSLANTYGIFTSERMPDYPPVTTGSLGYKSQGILNFMTGNYYVKVMSAGVQEAEESSIAMIAEKVNARLAQPEGLPEELKLFPEEGKVALSDTYIAQNFLGYSFFHSAYSARYGGQGEIQLFIIRLTPEEIQKILDLYFALVKEDKVQQKNGVFTVNDLFNGTVYLKQKGNTLAGVLNSGNEPVALGYLNQVTGKLP